MEGIEKHNYSALFKMADKYANDRAFLLSAWGASRVLGPSVVDIVNMLWGAERGMRLIMAELAREKPDTRSELCEACGGRDGHLPGCPNTHIVRDGG